jgi:hypothetical protein
MRRTIVAALALAGLSACSMKNDVGAVTNQIAQFHQAMNAGQYEAIYSGASAEMQASAGKAATIGRLAAIHAKLGAFVSGEAVSWADNFESSWTNGANVGGHSVTARYAARYERGAAEETFVYRVSEKGVALLKYDIGSAAPAAPPPVRRRQRPPDRPVGGRAVSVSHAPRGPASRDRFPSRPRRNIA